MKALLINGSPKEAGNTYAALRYVADALEEEGIDAEIYQIPQTPVSGCLGCRKCKEKSNRCIMDGDAANVILDKMDGADALVIGSPVFYAAPNGHLLSVLDRVFFAGAGSGAFRGKPAAAVCVARRGGTASTLDVLQKYFTISGMPIAPSTYWPMIYGDAPGETKGDGEGIQTMQMTGKAIAWLLKCIDAGRKAEIEYPVIPAFEKVRTNFIR